MNDKVFGLYTALKDAGADVGTEKEFNDHFFAKGDQGYKNRYEIWKTFYDAGADVGKNYEEFRDWLGLQPKPKPEQQAPQSGIKTQKPSSAPAATPKPQQHDSVNAENGYIFTEGGLDSLQQGYPARYVEAPTSKGPDDTPVGTPWGTEGSATGKSRPYNPTAPGQVRSTELPSGVSYQTPFRPDLTVAQRDEIERENNFAVEQNQKLIQDFNNEEERRNKPLVDTGNNTVNKSVIKTQGQWDDELQRGISKLGSIISPMVSDAMKKADETWWKVMTEGAQVPRFEGMEMMDLKRANDATDPDKILQGLQKSLKAAYDTPQMKAEIEKQANALGIPMDEYITSVVAPALQQRLSSEFANSQIASRLPKNTAEYILQGLNNSVFGMLGSVATQTQSQRRFATQAQAMTDKGLNPHYDPGVAARLAQMGVTFAADAPFFGLYGKIGGNVVKQVAEQQIKNLMAKGLSEGAARSLVGTALENSVGARMRRYIMQHVGSSAITMGGFNLTSEGARQIHEGEFDPARLAESTAEGLATGAAFGVTGGAAQAITQPLTGISRIGAKAAGFGIEAETLYATEELAKMMHGEEGFTNPFEGSVDALMKLGVMKASSGHLLTKALETGVGIKKDGLRKTLAKSVANGLFGQPTGVKFTPEEEAYVRNSIEGKNLLESLSQMHPEVAVSEVNGKKKLTPEGEKIRQQLSDSYNRFMANTEIPATVKQKVALTLGGLYRPGLETGSDIIHNDDGSVTLKTRDKDFNCIQELKFDNFSDAESWREEHEGDFRLNDAVNMFNGSPVEARAKMVAELMEEYGVDATQARSMIEGALRGSNGTDFNNEQFLSIYDTIRRNAYPDDELNVQRRYWEGMQLTDEEKHSAVIALRIAEKRLSRFGKEFADEIINGYPDEKMAELAQRQDVTGKQLQAALDYYNKSAVVDGMMDETSESVDQKVDAANSFIQKNAHPDTGMLITGTAQGKNVYVTAGHFQLSPDGRLMPTDNSGAVIVRDINTGEINVVNPNEVRVTSVNDPKVLIASNDSMEGLRGQLTKEAENVIEMHPETPAEPIEEDFYTGADGQRYMTMQVADDTGRPTWLKVPVGEQNKPIGAPQPLDIEEYRKAKSDEKDLSEIPLEEVAVADETPGNTEEISEPQPENVIEAPIDETSVEETPIQRIPVDENGKMQYEQAAAEDTLAYLNEKYGEEKTQKMIATIAANAAKELESLQKEDVSKFTDMADLDAHEEKVLAAEKKVKYWRELMKPEEKPVVEEQKPAEEELPAQKPTISNTGNADLQPANEQEPASPAELETPVTPPAEPAKPAEPEQPVGPTAEQKIAQGTIKNNIGKRFGFQNQDGTRSEVTIDALKGDDLVTVTRQDYDKNGQHKGEPYQDDFKLTDVGNSIVNGLMKPALSTDEKLRKVFKVTVGDVPLADVLKEDEQRQLLDLYAKGDKTAIGNLTGDLIDAHYGDLILRSRDIRNAKVDQIMNSNVSREQKLRKVRDLYKGYQDAEVMLEDETLKPGTIEEYVADLHSRVPKNGEGPIAYFSYEKDGTPITGLQDETGYGKKNSGDADAFKPWLAPQGKGVSLMKYAEQIHSQLPEPIQEQYDVNQVRNAILNVFGGAERPSDITTMVIKRGILQAENAARRMEEMWIDGGPSLHKLSPDDKSFLDHLTPEQAATASEIDKALMNELVTETVAAGVPMVKNVAEGQAVLDAYNKLNGEASDADYSPKPQKVTDQQELDELNKGKTVKRYRAMQLIDGKLYPPMSAKVDGEMREPTEIGVWEKAEERPDLVKNGKFVLNKGQKGQGNVPAAYNPYFHTSTSGLNDQFTSAYKRPELVVVEVEIPESELTSGYKAEGAKDAVGNVDWHSGVVNGQLPADRQRQVTLSRYSKVNRIVPNSEVADMIAKQLEGTNVEVPYNVVTPAQRAELEKRGVKISDKPAGSVTEDINGNPIKQQKADVVDMFAKNVEMPLKPVEETIPQNPSVWEALNIKDRVEAMSPQELIDNYRRINSQMLEDGLDVDEHSEKVKADYIAKNGVKGLGQVMADDLNYLSNKYGFGKLSLRWDLQDRIKELGLEEYLNNDKPYDPNEKPAVSEKAKAEVVDMHGRPSFFKTPDGHAYGFTYQGKIYIDPRIATAETPIHEYGHLWAEMKRQTSPDEWNHIKDVLLRDEMVKPFIDKVKREYPELEGKDDAFAEEVLTQFSGKHGAEKLRKMAEEIKHELGDDAMAETIAQAAIRKVKSILNEFWKGVADMMGWKYTNAEDVADTILRDMLNGVNPTEKIAEGTDKVMKQQQEIERTLMGVHNLSEDKLRKVIKAGGLANPSLAVVDTNQGIHTSYGDISLIPKASLIDKRTGRNAGTFAGDAWTPTYPHVERMLTKQGEKRAADIAKEVAGNDEDMARHIRSRINDYYEGAGDRLHFLFLKQKGLNPQIRPERIAHSQDEYDAITKIFGEPTSNMPNRESITKEQNDALVDLMVSVYEKKLRAGMKDPDKPLDEKTQQLFDARVEEYRKNLLDDDGYIWFAKGDNFIYDNWRDEKRRQNPQPDWYGTDNDASYQVAKEGLAEEYEKWKESLLTDDEVEEKLFAGYTPSGNRRYLPNTVENASRLMNKNADQNAYDQGGFGPTRAMLLQNFASLADIRRHKDLIQKDEKVEERTKELSDELFDIINQISDMQKISDNHFSNIDYAEARLQEAMGKKNPIRHLNREYGYDIPEDGELASQLMNFMEDVKNLPAKYFETKFKRPVTLDEFEIAVVPEGTSEDVVKALKDAGLDVRTFDNTGGEEVKKENRRKAVMDAVTDRDDILFQKKSEGEETLKDEDSLRDSEKKERPLQEMPLKSSDRFNGDHVKGLEEYEDELRKKLADDSVERTADSNTVPSVSDNRVDGFWDERQAEEGLEAGSDRLHVGTPRQQDRRRLGLSQEERADIEAKLAAIEKEKERRKQAWEDFAKKYHVSDNGWIWYKDYLKAFEDMNTDPEAQRLMDKIFSVLEGDFGELSIKAGLNKRGSHSDGLFGDIEISQDWITRGAPDSEKAKTMLHELLHKVTHDNIELYRIPGFRKLMGKEAQAAVKELYAIHDALKERYPDIYGSKSVDEMVAEMGDADFRKALQDVTYDKNKNVTLWDRFKAAIKRLFTKDNGPEMASDADKAAMKALDKLLDAYDKNRSTFQRTVRTAKNVAKDVIFGDDSSKADNYYYSEESELTPENEQYWKQWDAAMKKWKERNNIPADAEGVGEKPVFRQGEDLMDFAGKMSKWVTERNLWQTAPKLEDYRQARNDKADADEAHAYEKQYPDSEHARRWRVAADLARIRHAMSRQKTYDKATVKAVTDFANDFMKMGYGDHLTRGEIERMLSSVKNATGSKDVKKQLDNIMNVLMNSHLRNLESQVWKLASIKELKQTAQGVETQGRLELKGQRMIQAFREATQTKLTPDEIRNRMEEVAERMTRNDEEAPMWEQEYEGLGIALQYAENIEESRKEWAEIDREYMDAVKDYKTSGRTYQAQQELLESLEQAKMDNIAERIANYGGIIGRLEGNIAESIQGAKEFVEREKQRVKKIHNMANFDLAGKDMGGFHQSDWKKRLSNGTAARFFLGPLGTFEQMLKQFGARNANGEGYLYDYFMRNWMKATDNAYIGERNAKEELDEKAHELFSDKIKRWSDLYELERTLPTMDITVTDQGEQKTFTLTQGNLMYIYMADKMNDGRMKLRKMGITEEDVEQIKDFLDQRLVQLADWLQGEYLPSKRPEYNKVHERMFGAPMAAIDNYFPLKILGDARVKEEDVNVPDSETLPSTITGNIIKRRKNALPLDILNTNALSLALEHVEDMERWAAQAEWNKDVSTLLSYTTFRNKVKNMNTIYGSGDQLWNAFKDAAKMAAGKYSPKVSNGSTDKAISNIAKGVTAAKISFRVYTAFKQILSAPAFLHDVDLKDFVKAGINPYGSWKWAMENMPVFEKRWKSRQMGDTRLMDDPTDWKLWKNNVVQLASRWGMSPNALVDGVTCAVGARAIYETRLKKYKEMGMEENAAKKRALQDAEIGYNLTQQSSDGAFVSAIQKDRTVLANALSVFRNSSMAYTRQWVDAARNLKHRMEPGYKEDSIKFMTRQFQDQMGLDEAQAQEAAEAAYNRAGRRDVARLLNMMFGVTIAWNLGASLPYLLIGDDDKTKKEMLTDALMKGLVAGPTEGLAAGNIISDFVGQAVNEGVRKSFKENGSWEGIKTALDNIGDQDINPLPLFADLERMISKIKYDGYAALQDVFNIAAQSAVGVNPQTATDIFNAIMDYAAPGWDGTSYTLQPENILRAKEFALFVMRFANAPTSSWRNKYIDELGMNAEDAQKLPYDEMAKRYAHYKHWKDAPIMGWMRGEEGRQEKMEKIQKQFDKAVAERIERLTGEELMFNVARSRSIDERRAIAKTIAKRLGIEKSVDGAKSKEEWQKRYQQLMTYEDIREDELLYQKKQEATARKDEKAVKAIDRALNKIRDKGKKKLGFDNDQEKMAKIRQWRREALEKALKAEATTKQ